jgi:hypothetical protein
MSNFKVRCIEVKKRDFTKGKEYQVVNGKIQEDHGFIWSSIRKFNNLDDINKFFADGCNGFFAKFELVTEPQQFTKDMLKTGMRVELKNGSRYVVLKDVETTFYGHQDFLLASGCDFLVGSEYEEDLTDKHFNSFTIMKVYKSINESNILNLTVGKLLWQRPEPRKIKKAEAEKLLSEHLEELIQIEG